MTIRGYRSAIAVIHKGFEDRSIVSNSPTLTKLLKAFFLQKSAYKTASTVASWSLPRVLRALVAAPFEPLAEASLRGLTVKTVFLLAVASGHRPAVLFTRFPLALTIFAGRRAVRLIPAPSFLAKNHYTSSKPVALFI